MKTEGRQKSKNVEDRRGSRGKMAAGGLSLGGVVVVLLIALLGGNPDEALQQMQAPVSNSGTYTPSAKEEQYAELAEVVLKDTEDAWDKVFREQLNSQYQYPTMVLYSGQVQSACGFSTSATGPFYCPGDYKLYLDLSFFDELHRQLGAPGDFAEAYVIAHEVGHHVQRLLGISDKVDELRGRVSKEEYNQLSVRLELQADFFAGVWAHETQEMKHVLERGDIEEAMGAARSVGDDRLQKASTGRVVPESFTHGTSAQRMRWFKKGFDTGDLSQGDTFSAETL